MQKCLVAVAVLAFVGGCSEPESVVISDEEADSTFANNDERILYALGVAIGEQISVLELSENEAEFVAMGVRDVTSGVPSKVDMDFFGPQINVFAERRIGEIQDAAAAEAAAELGPEKEASAAFAEEIAAEPGAETTASGLIFIPMTEGDGPMPAASDMVRVHYHGTLRDGTVFDSSVERGTPEEFRLNEVIPCWTEGVQMIQVGGTARLLCPSDIAYGDAGRPGIPGGAALLFEVELLEIL